MLFLTTKDYVMKKYILHLLLVQLTVTAIHSQEALIGTVTEAFDTYCPSGSIELKIKNGFPNYIVTWYKNGVLYYETTSSGDDGNEDLNNILPGLYTVKIQDALCGSVQEDFAVGILQNVFTLDQVENCTYCYTIPGRPGYYSNNNGNIFGTIQNDDLYGYTILWTGPNGFSSNHEDILNLCPGIYTLTITNYLGCQRQFPVEVCCCGSNAVRSVNDREICHMDGEIPNCYLDGNPLAVDTVIFHSLTEDCNGFISIYVSGGYPPIMAQWDTPNGSYCSR